MLYVVCLCASEQNFLGEFELYCYTTALKKVFVVLDEIDGDDDYSTRDDIAAV